MQCSSDATQKHLNTLSQTPPKALINRQALVMCQRGCGELDHSSTATFGISVLHFRHDVPVEKASNVSIIKIAVHDNLIPCAATCPGLHYTCSQV